MGSSHIQVAWLQQSPLPPGILYRPVTSCMLVKKGWTLPQIWISSLTINFVRQRILSNCLSLERGLGEKYCLQWQVWLVHRNAMKVMVPPSSFFVVTTTPRLLQRLSSTQFLQLVQPKLQAAGHLQPSVGLAVLSLLVHTTITKQETKLTPPTRTWILL